MQGFCPLKTKITQFPEGFHLNIPSSWVRERFRQTGQIFTNSNFDNFARQWPGFSKHKCYDLPLKTKD